MSRRVKQAAPGRPSGSARDRAEKAAGTETNIGDFFAGVERLRAFLERNVQDPEHQQRRLARMARELVKQRSAAELCLWLAEETREAVGARACTLALLDGGWQPWVASGTTQRRPPADACAALAGPFAPQAPPEPQAVGNDLLVPLAGVSRVPACLWLELDQPLVPSSIALLAALASTAGVMVEQELSAELLLRDPVTTLWAENAFLEQAMALVAQGGKDRRHQVLLAVRLIGLDAVRTTRGILAAQQALRDLAAAASEAWPGELLGMRFGTLLALLCAAENEAGETMAADRHRRLAAALRQRAGETGLPLAVAAVFAPAQPAADLRRLAEHLCRQAEELSRPGVHQLNEA